MLGHVRLGQVRLIQTISV